jgi:hypothetical protein
MTWRIAAIASIARSLRKYRDHHRNSLAGRSRVRQNNFCPSGCHGMTTEAMCRSSGKSLRFIRIVSSPFATNILLPFFGNMWLSPCIPCPYRGALRDRHERWARDAMDAEAAPDERGTMRTSKGVWSRPPDAGVKSADWLMSSAGDGGKKSPVTEESALYAVNHRAGKAGVFPVEPVVLPPCFCCTGPMGAIGARSSLRPLNLQEGGR